MTATPDQADWAAPGARPAAPGVHRIPLPLPVDGLRAVNCHVLSGPSGLVLIDPGWASTANEWAVRDGLRDLGHSLDDVALCIATHQHWDHYTQACAWREARGVKVLLGHEEWHSIAAFSPDTRPRYPAQVDLLIEVGAADLARRVAALDAPPHERGAPFGLPDGWLRHGDRIPLDRGALEVVATPGHTRGHIALRYEAAGVIFTGDHVLPGITPSIGFEWSPEPQPLQSFLRSLESLLVPPDAVALPAHGPALPGVHARVREQIRHHEERLAEILDMLGNGAATAYEIAEALPWTRHARTLDELPDKHRMIAVMEIRAHLELLRTRGDAGVLQYDGVRRYAPTRRRWPA